MNPKFKQTVMCGALALALGACASSSPIEVLKKKALKVSAGMTDRTLKRRLGSPGDKRFSGAREAWQWCASSVDGIKDDHYVLVWLREGKVERMETYSNDRKGGCESHFKPIDWSQGVVDAASE